MANASLHIDVADDLEQITVLQLEPFHIDTDLSMTVDGRQGASGDFECSNAMQSVLGTTEIAENIFENIDRKELLSLMAVCQHFRQIVRTSVRLGGHMLHLWPCNPSQETLAELLPVGIFLHHSQWTKLRVSADARILNRFHKSRTKGDGVTPSWAAMTPIQPPLHKINVGIACDNCDTCQEFEVEGDMGVTLGHICSALLAIIKEQHKGGCRVRRSWGEAGVNREQSKWSI